MTYTTIEQSKKLIELGLDKSSADMRYPKLPVDLPTTYSTSICIGYDNEIDDLPAWTLEALLNIIPNNSKFKCAIREYHENKITWTYWCYAISEYIFEGETDFECIYKTVCWLLENNYIKNEKD